MDISTKTLEPGEGSQETARFFYQPLQSHLYPHFKQRRQPLIWASSLDSLHTGHTSMDDGALFEVAGFGVSGEAGLSGMRGYRSGSETTCFCPAFIMIRVAPPRILSRNDADGQSSIFASSIAVT